MGTFVRFTDPTGKTSTQSGEPKTVRRLFNYAVSIATADFLIELVVDGRVKKSHRVEYQLPPELAAILG